MTPLQRVLELLKKVKKKNDGWAACCPAHEDRHPSLGIAEGDDGRVLLRCRTGCTTEQIVRAIGLTMADLFDKTASTSTRPRQSNKNIRNPQASNRATTDHSTMQQFGSSAEAIAALERRQGKKKTNSWTYHDADGNPVQEVVRFDDPKGKHFLPVSRNGDFWCIKALPEPRPLYRLPELKTADVVLVLEGEKTVEAARGLGFVATTSLNGSICASKADWNPLAGKEVWILPDNDAPGRKYAETVKAILSELSPPCVVKIIELPDLPDNGDIVEWIEAHGDAAEPAGMKAEIEAIAAKTPNAGELWPELTPFDADLPVFPTHCLPTVLRNWVESESHATQTPPDLAALLAVAVCGSTIARKVEVEAREGYREPVNLYVTVILDPSNRKSAVFRDATRPLKELEQEMVEASRAEYAKQLSRRRMTEARLKELEKQYANKPTAELAADVEKLAAELAEMPEPVLPRLIVDDVTAEKLGEMLAKQGGRLASISAEGNVFELMKGLYAKNGGPQIDIYLKAHSGDDIVSDRCSRDTVAVSRPALTCAYTVQPSVIKGMFGNTVFRGRGLLARFLYAIPKSWIGEREIATPPVPAPVRDAYIAKVKQMGRIEGETVLPLSNRAANRFVEWEREIEERLADGGAMETIKDWGGKIAGETLRLAGIMHVVEYGATGEIGPATIDSAIEIAKYLIPHAESTLCLMEAADDKKNEDALYVLRWIVKKEKQWFEKRDAQQHGRQRFRRADDIDPALMELTKRGYIRLQPNRPAGVGRPPSPSYEVNHAAIETYTVKKRPHYTQNSGGSRPHRDSEDIEDVF